MRRRRQYSLESCSKGAGEVSRGAGSVTGLAMRAVAERSESHWGRHNAVQLSAKTQNAQR